MKKFNKHTPEQIVAKLEQADKLKAEGKNNAEICRELTISEATLARWRSTYRGMDKSQAKLLRELKKENDQLKRLLGQSELEKQALRELAEGKF
ncbi:hypothetical protein C1Y63_12390 [Corynebacterium sp. 13CS0277]|uniref:transposase n=1 Tax=Corynebacterium sp. 13CS0277 TaxID=2071994 RepID=UPI000D0447BE|nr:transposase [Corynebacterium sp. 13CS0277]PRQ10271.1 hypothetical protein C1Y63_12390 [Corynebacterium sp. 13CS0277]